MFETLEQQKAETARQEKAEADRSHSWPVRSLPTAFTNDQLNALRSESQRLGRALTDEERNHVLRLKKREVVLDGQGVARVIEVQ